jgi:CubicO group peptidase (beta-lactamase class C family)
MVATGGLGFSTHRNGWQQILQRFLKLLLSLACPILQQPKISPNTFTNEKIASKMMKASLPSFLFLFVLLSGVFSETAAQEYQNQPKTIEDLKQEIENIIREHNVPGAAIALVTKNSQIWAGGIGYSNVENSTPVNANSIFRWGSVSKSFVAVAIQILAEQKLVHLEDKIKDIAPKIEINNRWESTHPVKLVHCLEHTTGFDDLHFNECAVDDPQISLLDALAINPHSRNSRWEPGTYKSYSNIGPVIAAHIVETVTGQSFENFVTANIFNPLGMETSSFYYPKESNLMSTGYEGDGTTTVQYDHIVYRPAGSLNASAIEMALFVRMLLNRGTLNQTQILSSPSVSRMETPKTTLTAKTSSSYGYGLGSYTTLRNGYVFHGHDGMIAGFTASYGYNAGIDRGYAVSINKVSETALQQIIQAVIEYFTAGIDNPARPVMTIPAEELQPLTGYYKSITPMTQLMHTLLMRFVNVRKITLQGDTLLSGNFLSGRQKKLMSLSKNVFYRTNSNEILSFIEDGDDMVISYDGLRGNFKKVSRFSVFFQLGIFISSFMLMVSSLLFALIWIPKKFLGRLKGTRHLKARLFPLFSVLFFFATYLPLLNGLMTIELDKPILPVSFYWDCGRNSISPAGRRNRYYALAILRESCSRKAGGGSGRGSGSGASLSSIRIHLWRLAPDRISC